MAGISWFATHKPDWKPRSTRTERALVPKAMLGEEDAFSEWESNVDAQLLYSNIPSYSDFVRKESLFLFGRRGTGKTALLYKLRYDIDQGRKFTGAYSGVVLIVPIDFVAEFQILIKGSCLRGLEESELSSLARRAWKWLIVTCAYSVLAQRFRDLRTSSRSEVADMIHHAIDNSVPRSEIMTVITTLFLSFAEKALADASEGQNQLAIATLRLRGLLTSGSVQDFEKAISSALKEKRTGCILALVETEEVYRTNDTLSSSIRGALIDVVLDLYNNHQRGGLLAKAAFPAEIYPHLSVTNRQKIENKLVTISWRYSDLVKLVAKRYQRLLGKSLSKKELEKAISMLDDFTYAKNFLDDRFPRFSLEETRGRQDTLSYVIGHTQGNPRQVISIFNCIVTMTDGAGLTEESLREHGLLVKKAVHERLDILVDGALHIYDGIYPNAVRIVRRVLTGLPSYFPASELDKAISFSNEIRNMDFSREDVRQLLLESGAIGIALEAPQKLDTSTERKLILDVLFQYQITSMVVISSSALCVIHPMFYEELETRVDSSVIACPQSSRRGQADD